MLNFRLKIHLKILLIQIVESGCYLYIVLGEPMEYYLFCLAYEKKEYLVFFTFKDNLLEINH